MKCPKCGFNSFEFHDTCKKCGKDLTAFKASFNIRPLAQPRKKEAFEDPFPAEVGAGAETASAAAAAAAITFEPAEAKVTLAPSAFDPEEFAFDSTPVVPPPAGQEMAASQPPRWEEETVVEPVLRQEETVIEEPGSPSEISSAFGELPAEEQSAFEPAPREEKPVIEPVLPGDISSAFEEPPQEEVTAFEPPSREEETEIEPVTPAVQPPPSEIDREEEFPLEQGPPVVGKVIEPVSRAAKGSVFGTSVGATPRPEPAKVDFSLDDFIHFADLNSNTAKEAAPAQAPAQTPTTPLATPEFEMEDLFSQENVAAEEEGAPPAPLAKVAAEKEEKQKDLGKELEWLE